MKTKALVWSFCALGAAITISTSASALPVSILSYDMLNGNNGKYDYFDEDYTGGTGNPLGENSPLAGGLGKLTDGVYGTTRFDVDEYLSTDGGKYVGWSYQEVPNATITFNLAPGSTTNTVTIWVDDADGVGSVNPPDAVTINGTEFDFIDPTPLVDVIVPSGVCEDTAPCIAVSTQFVNTLPFSNTFVGTWETDTLVIEFEYDGGYIMVSEVELGYTPPPVIINPTPPAPPSPPGPTAIPEPGTLAIFGLGLMGLGFARRRKSA
jgi:hypothetical protein